MGIFSLFGKKDRQQTTTADKETARPNRSAAVSSQDAGRRSSRSAATKRDAQAARATALKIDAIEIEMSSEFVNLTTIQGEGTASGEPATLAPAPAKTKPAETARTKPRAESKKAAKPARAEPAMSTESGTTTALLLDSTSMLGDGAPSSSEAAAVIEEAAILYANGQNAVVEQMLQTAIAEDMLGDVTRKAWWMLFDLYQVNGKQQEFEHLSIEYANKFETSPPTWIGSDQQEPQAAAPTGAVPIVPFGGKLDSSSIKPIERIRKLAESQHALRLEFTRINHVDPTGCGLLLDMLNTLQKSGHELTLVGIAALVEKVRAILEVGRPDDTENAWLLLLELLRLLNRETEFEEASIDYCVTFEVSPPAFVAPQTRITTAQAEPPSSASGENCFMMPALVEGRIDNLILAIAAYSDEHELAIIDCTQLARVDFNAAGRLLTGLAPFCGNGKMIEFHHVNHLVAELFNVIGLKDIVRILPHKH